MIRPTAWQVIALSVGAGAKRSKVYGTMENVIMEDPQMKNAVPVIGTIGWKLGLTVFAGGIKLAVLDIDEHIDDLPTQKRAIVMKTVPSMAGMTRNSTA